MKTYRIFIYVARIIFLISCEKEPFIKFGFDSPVQKNSNGSVIADISSHVKHVRLQGFISLYEGEATILLEDPTGVNVYSNTIVAPDKFYMDEIFEARPGYWKLKYESREGVGEIDLHLQPN